MIALQMAGPASNYWQLVTEGKLLPFEKYDTIIVSYSGGKDSLACLLHLLDMGVPKHKIELWHQHVDGEPGTEQAENGLMDWPVTEAYVRATGEALGITVRFQWKDGGFEGEMLRENSRTRGMAFEDGDGNIVRLSASSRSKPSTRMKFPQVSADLSVRWCSPYLKIDVGRRAINNDPRFDTARILFVTGERRQESTARSKYKEVEPHGCDGARRRVDQWRAVIDWQEEDVWAIIKRHRIAAHPAYYCSWGRVSCLACIFGNRDQWASVRQIAPDRFERIAAYERRFGLTIKKGESVVEQADRGQVYEMDDRWTRLAMGRHFPASEFFVPDGQDWQLPSGAYHRCGGPT